MDSKNSSTILGFVILIFAIYSLVMFFVNGNGSQLLLTACAFIAAISAFTFKPKE